MIAASPERPNSERDDRFSTRDLLGYLLCRHATWRDIQRTIDPGHFERPVVLNDDLRKMRSVLGQKHEQQWVEALRARGITVESLEEGWCAGPPRANRSGNGGRRSSDSRWRLGDGDLDG